MGLAADVEGEAGLSGIDVRAERETHGHHLKSEV